MKIKLYSSILFCFMTFSLFSQGHKIYGLNFVGSELRLASMDVNTGNYEIISQNQLSPDQFIQGNADFDPIGKRYFYSRVNQFFTVDALNGSTISNPTMTAPSPVNGNSLVSPITNFAYNWLDGEIYGVNHQYQASSNPFGNGLTELRLCKINATTGQVNLISDNPISTTPFLSGNSDIDPVNRRYIYATPEKIYTVDLDTGEPLFSPDIVYPASSNSQTFVNLTYDWQNNIIYGLNFESIPNPNPFPNTLTSELKLATINPETGVVTILSPTLVSNDGFSMGSCDIDPTGNRYFYVRMDSLYTVNLTDGTLISKQFISNPNNAIAPLINTSYDDLTETPSEFIDKDMGEELWLNAGETIELNAWVGDDVNYLWQDGSTDHTIMVSEPGEYAVTISRDDFILKGSIMVQALPTSTTNLQNNIILDIYPNPVEDILNYEIENRQGEIGKVMLVNLDGKVLLENNISEDKGFLSVGDVAQGIYLLKAIFEDKTVVKKVVLK